MSEPAGGAAPAPRRGGRGMMALMAVVSRYLGLATQLLLVVLISRHLSQADAGAYLLMFGAATSTYAFAGLGIPDGLVKAAPEAMAAGRGAIVRGLVTQAARTTLWTSALLLFGGVGAALLAGLPPQIVAGAAGWWTGYALLFCACQGLVALGRPQLSAFLFYSSVNLAAVALLLPYLLTSAHPGLMGAMLAGIGATFATALVAGVMLVRAVLRHAPAPGEGRVSVRPLARLGATIATARILQASIYWIPSWVTGIMLSTASAAPMAAAGRLVIGASGLIAAFRFTVRHRIVVAATLGDWAGIERSARLIATGATAFAIAALIGLALLGEPIIVGVFGARYAEVVPLLAILLVGAIGESLGGPVDEVLKLTGEADRVLATLSVVVALELALAFAAARFGTRWVAATQALAFCALYGSLILHLRARRGITILPYLRPSALKAAARAG